MKSMNKLLAFLPVLAFGLCVGCNNPGGGSRLENNDQAEDSARMENSTGYTYENPSDAAGSDGEILAFVNAINTNEINAAQEAKRKDINKNVMDYADMLLTEHQNNMEKTNQLASNQNISATETDRVTALKQKGQDLLTRLQGLNGANFESAYVQAMIKDHQDGLNLLDNQLIPQADNESVKQHLTETRQHIAKHLERAQELSGNMNGNAQ